MSLLSPEGPFYQFALIGYIPHLRQVLENYPRIKKYQGPRDDCDYIFKTETGVAYLQIGIVLGIIERANFVKEGILPEVNEKDWRDFAHWQKDGVHFEVGIHTPPEFIEELIKFFDNLAKESTFVIKILSPFGYPYHLIDKIAKEDLPPSHPIIEYPKLRDKYQTAYESHPHFDPGNSEP
jgi:hypothetical protein